MEKRTRKSSPKIDLSNQRFGKLIAISYIKGGKWLCKCDCGNDVTVDTRNLRSGHTKSCGCGITSSKNVKDMTGFENEGIQVLHRDGSDNQGTALWRCRCKYCGNFFTTRGSSIRAGYINSCGCLHSINEQKIAKMLSENNIEYATQYTFPDLIGEKRQLRFDFAVFNNGILSHLIEFQGMQHYYKPKGSWGEDFEKQQSYDLLKQQYCIQKNIRLIIIPYDMEYTIKDLL